MDQILPIYKPAGITSFDVIRAYKRAVHPEYKVGHGGTLDPFADGVLLLLLGKATKKMDQLSALPKTYRATAALGASSDTLDRTGVITNSLPADAAHQALQAGQIKIAASQFVGEIEQAIPDYSAAKVNGVPRYKLARKGQALEQKSKMVTIYSLDIEKVEMSYVTFTAEVSSGTYIRQLSYDIFKSIGVESYLESLTRTEIGEYNLDKCCQIKDFS